MDDFANIGWLRRGSLTDDDAPLSVWGTDSNPLSVSAYQRGDDVEAALRRNNVELPAGELESTSRQFTVRAQSRLSRVEQFEAVLARQPAKPLDFDQRMRAVKSFRKLPESTSLAAANKRIRNILRKADSDIPAHYDASLFQENAERELASSLQQLDAQTRGLFEARDYTNALCRLAALQSPVDTFFDDVMVMTEDTALRDNRLALLQALSNLFLQVADISLLQD